VAHKTGALASHALERVELVIGHMRAEHRMGRNYPKGRHGDRINAVLAAAGYNVWPAPVCKLWLREIVCSVCADLSSLKTLGRDGDPRVLVLITSSASSAM
jgi:hypothetical protein